MRLTKLKHYSEFPSGNFVMKKHEKKFGIFID